MRVICYDFITDTRYTVQHLASVRMIYSFGDIFPKFRYQFISIRHPLERAPLAECRVHERW